MNKRLKPTTIIPAELYVERAADRQLEAIVDEMGRPGYVLVARQMGKTNLLLAMRRRRRQAGDIVLYLDLSNRFATPRAFFRNVVDSLIDAAGSTLLDAVDNIADIRKRELEPNVEYDRSLRAILRSTHQRIVIIFDEIDSLVNVPYSDAVLAQIRSMYFARESFNEYWRLTYTLSGVIEPSKLIKDRNISPFNIGEEIYLNDFTRDEVSTFCIKAELDFSRRLVDEVYRWTSGNPRMTWDVLSALEDEPEPSEADVEGLVAGIVRRLYLAHVDRAPIDHIRDLVATDRQVRDAIEEIRYGAGAAVSDEVRGRLYLAGVIGQSSSGDIAIKNRIIDEALSGTWLAQLSAGRRGILSAATQAFSVGRYEESARLLKDYERVSDERLPAAARFELGMSHFYLREYAEAADALQLVADEPWSEEAGAAANYQLGRALTEQGKFAEALRPLRAAAAFDGPLQNQARLAVGSTLLRAAPADNAPEILAINDSIVSWASTSSAADPIADGAIVAAARYNSAQAHQALGNLDAAREELAAARSVAPPILLPAIELFQLNLTSDSKVRAHIAESAASYIVDQAIPVDRNPISEIQLGPNIIAHLLSRLEQSGRAERFDRLLSYVHDLPIFDDNSKIETLISLFRSAKTNEENTALTYLLLAGINRYGEGEAQHVFSATRLLAIYAPESQKTRMADRYVRDFKSRMTADLITQDDLLVIVTKVAERIQVGDFLGALSVVQLIEPFRESAQSVGTFIYIVLLNSELIIYQRLNLFEKSNDTAKLILQLCDGGPELSDVDETVSPMLESIRQGALRQLNSRQSLNSQKIGRNEKVLVRDTVSGMEMSVKYKVVEAGIRSGRYTLISLGKSLIS